MRPSQHPCAAEGAAQHPGSMLAHRACLRLCSCLLSRLPCVFADVETSPLLLPLVLPLPTPPSQDFGNFQVPHKMQQDIQVGWVGG